jgi:hypothetical protein
MTQKQIASQMEALKAKMAKLEAELASKSTPKVAKPSTKTEAVAQWKSERNINADTQANYKAIYAANWELDWAKWTSSKAYKGLSGSARKEANRLQAVKIRNSYRKLAGMNSKSFE